MASIAQIGETTSSATVILIGLDTSYAKNDRVCSWYLAGIFKGTSTLGAYVSSGGEFTFTNLASDMGYAVTCVVDGDNWAQTATFSATVFTSAEAPPALSVTPWSWLASNGSATAAQTQTAYNAVLDRGKVNAFSYLVWNDLVDKVYDYRTAKGHQWANNYASYANTRMSASNKTLTATKFNSLRYNIGSLYSTGIAEVATGDPVYGGYFVTLADCINALIAQG